MTGSAEQPTTSCRSAEQPVSPCQQKILSPRDGRRCIAKAVSGAGSAAVLHSLLTLADAIARPAMLMCDLQC